jgi:uncharacterized protein HemY
LGNWASGKYLLLFGFILLAAGILVAYSSLGMVQQNYFGSDGSTLSDSSVILLVGVLVGVVGALFFLVGLFSVTSRPRRLYY